MSAKRTPADYAETAAAQAVRGRPLTARETTLVDAALGRLRRYEAARERKHQDALHGTHARPGDLEAFAAAYKDLRPVIDPVLEAVLTDCPHCHAQDDDPAGMWRPARVVPRGDHLIVLCEGCGYRHERPL